MDIERILRDIRTVAIVGASANPARASNEVWQYLKSASDYELYLVNPTISEVDGTKVYPSLADLPTERSVEHLIIGGIELDLVHIHPH